MEILNFLLFLFQGIFSFTLNIHNLGSNPPALSNPQFDVLFISVADITMFKVT